MSILVLFTFDEELSVICKTWGTDNTNETLTVGFRHGLRKMSGKP